MIYVLARVTDGTKLLAYMCTDISVEAISKTSGAMNPNFAMVHPKQLTDALQYSKKEMEERGYAPNVANVYNKRNVVNIKLVNGIPQSEVSGGYPVLLSTTRNVIPNTPSGIILAEYRSYKGELVGYCLALFNPQSNLFDLGRARANALAVQMENTQQAGYNLISNAILSVDPNTGINSIVGYAQGFEQFTIVEQVTTSGQRTNLTKIVAGEDKKKLGKTATTIINNISESAEEVTGNVDLFRSLSPEQASFIQYYYMDYTKQVFECLRKTSRLDISSEKLAKLDMFRVDSDIEWEYTGIKVGSRIGSFTCALGHPLKRAHTAEAKNLLDANGDRAKLIFGLTCLSDFFNLNSEDIPVLSKAERIMVDEIAYITELFNDKKVAEGWKKVELFRHVVETLARKRHDDTTSSLTHLVGKPLAEMLLAFIKLDIPYPKSITELFLTNLSYRIGNTDKYRIELSTYITRRATERRTRESLANRRRVFEEYFGEPGYKAFKTCCRRADMVLDFLLDGKLQGEYGWNPENKSSGLRGMHDKTAKRIYANCEYTMEKQFGVKKYDKEDFELLGKLLNQEALLMKQFEVEIVTLSNSPNFASSLVSNALTDADFNLTEDSVLAQAIAAMFYNQEYNMLSLIELDYKDTTRFQLYTGSNIAYHMYSREPVEMLRSAVDKLSNITDKQKAKIAKFKQLLSGETHKPVGITRSRIAEVLSDVVRNETPLQHEYSNLRALTYATNRETNLLFSLKWGTLNLERTATETLARLMFTGDYKPVLGIGAQQDVKDMGNVVYNVNLTTLIVPDIIINNNSLLVVEKQTDGSVKKVVKLTYNVDSSIDASMALDNGSKVEFKISKDNLTPDAIRAKLESEDVKLEQSAPSDLTTTKARYKTVKTLQGIKASGNFKDEVVVDFGSFRVVSTIKSIKPVTNSDMFKIIFTHKVLGSRGKLHYEVDTEVRTSRLSDLETPVVALNTWSRVELRVKFAGSLWLLIPKPSAIVINTDEGPFTLPDSCIRKTSATADKKADSNTQTQATAQKQATEQATANSLPEAEKPMYIRGETVEVYDENNIYHALLYCYNYSGQETKYTPEIDVLLAKGVDYGSLKYGDRALIERDIAFHVSTYGVNLDKFKLPFEINEFVTPGTAPDLFKEIKEAYDYYSNSSVTYEDIAFNMNVAQSVLRWNRLTTKQRKHIDKLLQAYKEATGNTNTP